MRDEDGSMEKEITASAVPSRCARACTRLHIGAAQRGTASAIRCTEAPLPLSVGASTGRWRTCAVDYPDLRFVGFQRPAGGHELPFEVALSLECVGHVLEPLDRPVGGVARRRR